MTAFTVTGVACGIQIPPKLSAHQGIVCVVDVVVVSPPSDVVFVVVIIVVVDVALLVLDATGRHVIKSCTTHVVIGVTRNLSPSSDEDMP